MTTKHTPGAENAALIKMVEEWHGSNVNFYRLLLSMAAEIEANREEIEKINKVSHSQKPPM